MDQNKHLDMPQEKWKAWILSARPHTLSACVIPVLIGTAVSTSFSASFSLPIFFSALFCALFLQIGINYVNDAQDFVKKADTEERIGFARATQKGILSYSEMMTGAWIVFALSFLSAIPAAMLSSYWILPIVLICILGGYSYTGGPYPLAYVGLGDVFVILFFGLAITMTVSFALSGILTMHAFVAGLQVGLLSTTLIAINNLRDIHQDAKANKNTLAVRFGIQFSRIEIAATMLLPFFMGGYWWYIGKPTLAVFPFVGFPMALRVVRGIWETPPSPQYNLYQIKAAAVNMMFCLAFLAGSLWK